MGMSCASRREAKSGDAGLSLFLWRNVPCPLVRPWSYCTKQHRRRVGFKIDLFLSHQHLIIFPREESRSVVRLEDTDSEEDILDYLEDDPEDVTDSDEDGCQRGHS